MRHNNIALFIPHMGCPNQCSFCNQNTITGASHAPSVEEVKQTLHEAGERLCGNRETEAAFFGGSFTAVPRDYMVSLLETARDAVRQYGWRGIRISTRPDCVDDEVLALLAEYGVTSIELGAQSMDDAVLSANRRGHTAEQVRDASRRIRAAGFELGLQMMVGLYRDTEGSVLRTTEEIIRLAPDTVRVYPVVVLEGTKLAQWYHEGIYKPMTAEEAIPLLSRVLLRFWEEKIPVIKFGLHASEEVERDMAAGIYHPALKELCENDIYLNKAREVVEHLKLLRMIRTEVTFLVNPKAISKMIGQNRKNLLILEEETGWKCSVKGDESIPLYEVDWEA